MKRLNIRNTVIIVLALSAVHFSVGMFASPFLIPRIVKAISGVTPAKVTLGSMHVWPLTLSTSFKDLKIFDPKDPSQRLIAVSAGKAGISIIGLLQAKTVINTLELTGVSVDLKGEPDGSFNLERLGKKEEQGSFPAIPRATGDWLSRIFERVRSFEKKASQKAKHTAPSQEPARSVMVLGKGRDVFFKPLPGSYAFRIKHISARDVTVTMTAQDASEATIRAPRLHINNMGFDPHNGGLLEGVDVQGELIAATGPAGTLSLSFKQRRAQASISCRLQDVALSSLRFLYKETLPFDFRSGLLTLDSQTNIKDEALDSKNSISLRDHSVTSETAGLGATLPIPAPVLAQALNAADPFTIDFTISGTVDEPDYSGLEQSLMAAIKPQLQKAGAEIVNEKAQNVLGGFLKKNPLTGILPSAETQSAQPAPAK